MLPNVTKLAHGYPCVFTDSIFGTIFRNVQRDESIKIIQYGSTETTAVFVNMLPNVTKLAHGYPCVFTDSIFGTIFRNVQRDESIKIIQYGSTDLPCV